jgi:glycosyltransferase involved in cell wall biosynthesis
MRVCLVTGVFPPQRCGIGDYTEHLASSLAKLGADVHIMTSHHRSSDYHPTLKLHRIVHKWNAVGTGRLLRAVRAVRPHVVHLQFPSAAFRRAATLSALPGLLRACNHNVVLTLHEYSIAHRLSRVRQLLMAAASNRVITTNRRDHTSIARKLFWKAGCIYCINIASNIEVYPIEPDARAALRRTIGATVDSSVICFFGNTHPGKGLDDLVEAFGIVNQNMPETRLLIIGTFSLDNTLYNCMLRRKIAEANLRDKIHVTGYVERKRASQFLLASDICVLPFRDGLSVRRGSFLAAVRHGLPVITTSPQSPLPHNIIDGENVVFVSPGNTPQLAQTMQMLAQSPDIRRTIAHNLLELDRQFSWPDIARRTVQVYESL